MDNVNTLINIKEVIVWVLAVFAFLKATSSFLDFVSEKTKTNVDNKVALYLGKGLGLLGKLIDFVTANTKPKV